MSRSAVLWFVATLAAIAGLAGLLGEVTVPYTQTLYKYQKEVLVKLYRLYFQSQHRITGLIDGPDGKPWYRLTDEWLRVHYYAPAQDIALSQPVSWSRSLPILPSLKSGSKYRWKSTR